MVQRVTPKENPTNDAALSAVFHALADPTRRAIVDLLRESEGLRVTDLSAAFDISLNGVSKHVKVLEKARITTRQIKGREHWIQVDWNTLAAPHAWLGKYQRYWGARLDALASLFEIPNKGDPDE